MTAGAAGHTTERGARSRRRPWNQRLAPYLFVLPNMLIFGVFILYPAINGFNKLRITIESGNFCSFASACCPALPCM